MIKSFNILVVEDNPLNQKILSFYLKKEHHSALAVHVPGGPARGRLDHRDADPGPDGADPRRGEGRRVEGAYGPDARLPREGARHLGRDGVPPVEPPRGAHRRGTPAGLSRAASVQRFGAFSGSGAGVASVATSRAAAAARSRFAAASARPGCAAAAFSKRAAASAQSPCA